jgi:GTP pyrophosphokinase
VTLGRGVSIHRSDCANLARSNPDGERAYPAQWATDEGGLFVVSIRVEAIDRPRLLTEVADALSRQNANIISASTRTDDEGIATLYFEIELGDMELLDGVMDEVRGLDQVYEVTRSVHVSAG